jgi:hypothetical protein
LRTSDVPEKVEDLLVRFRADREVHALFKQDDLLKAGSEERANMVDFLDISGFTKFTPAMVELSDERI